MFLFPQSLYVEALTPHMMVFRGGAFEKSLDLEEVGRYDALEAFIRRGRDWSLPSRRCLRIAEKLAVCLPGEPSPKFQSAGIWIWDFPTSRADKK